MPDEYPDELVQEYVAPATVVAVKPYVLPAHIGPEFPAVIVHPLQGAGLA